MSAATFSEAAAPWRTIPAWVQFLIQFGYDWPSENPRVRRVALISMPCDSPSAGLVTLGAFIRGLADPRGNDTDGYHVRMIDYARQYLENCRDCDLPTCEPQTKRCGHLKKATGIVRSLRYPNRPHRISDKTQLAEGKLAFDDRTGTYWPSPQHLTEWCIDGDPPADQRITTGELSAAPYLNLVQNAVVRPENLKTSYSGLCLAGRTGGENASRQICASARFRHEATEYVLDDLLTVNNWSACNVSRVAFFNSRTCQFDRNAALPSLVVADGDAAFLNVFDRPEFRKADLIGTIHRTMERDRLEALGEKMAALLQWYVQDEDMLRGLAAVPRGISVSILRRRS